MKVNQAPGRRNIVMSLFPYIYQGQTEGSNNTYPAIWDHETKVETFIFPTLNMGSQKVEKG